MHSVEFKLLWEVSHAHPHMSELVDGRGRFLEALELSGGAAACPRES
jgi:hypothetical protein